MSLTAIEIFAGAGGAAMGLHQAGVRTLARCEWDRHACATLRAAAAAGFLDEAEVINEDVRKVDWSPYAGRADILWSSAPCQAWSSAGKRLGTADERNGWPWTFDVIDTIKPRWLIAENVMGLTHHRGDCDGTGPPEDCPADYFHRHILPECGRRFASVQWIELNASSFGVPQHRRRIFIVAGPRPIVWPKATHGDPNERQVRLFGEQLAPWVTVRQALRLDVVGIATARAAGAPVIDRDLCDLRDRPARTVHSDVGGGLRGGDMGVLVSGSRCRRDAQGEPRGPLEHTLDVPSYTIDGTPPSIGRGAIPQSRRPLRLDEPADSVQAGSPTSNHAPMIMEPPFAPEAIVYRRGRDGGAQDEAHSLDEPACALRGAAGGSTQPFLVDPKHPPVDPDGLAGAIRSGGSGHSAPPMWLRTEMSAAIAATVDAPAGTVTHSGNQYLHAVNPGTRAASQPGLLVKPSPSILARECKGTTVTPTTGEWRSSDVQCASDVLYLGAGIRRLTVTECAVLMAWPADYPLQGTKTAHYRQVGNGVCPPVALGLARAVRDADSR